MLLHRLLLAYSSGLVAAVSPCVIVLIPLMLVRFVRQDTDRPNESLSAALARSTQQQSSSVPHSTTQSLRVQLCLFLAGFQLSYLVFGFMLSAVLTSRIQDGFRLALGCLFLVAALLSAQGRVDPLRLPLAESAWWTGVSFAGLLSFNPCVVPFLAALLSLSSPATTVLSLVCFAQGLITPALLVVALGSRLLTWLEDSAFKMEKVKPWTFALLGVSGVYLLLAPVYTFSALDMCVALGGVALALALVHSATAQPAVDPITRSCRIGTDGLLTCSVVKAAPAAQHHSYRRHWFLTAVVLMGVLLCCASLLFEHDMFTHSAADSMLETAQQQQQTQVQVPDVAALQRGLEENAAAAGVELPSEQSGGPGKLHRLKRHMTTTPHDHLDQDALEVPSILTDAQMAGASNGVQLSAADLAALESLAAEAAAAAAAGESLDLATCIDMSQYPACVQCSVLLWIYRACVFAVALFTHFHDRIVLTLAASTSPWVRIPASAMRVMQRKLAGHNKGVAML